MAPRGRVLPFPYKKIQVHADPDTCYDFFESLKHTAQNSQVNEHVTFPTKDELSWAIDNCPNSIDSLAEVLGLTKKDLSGQIEFSSKIGPRQLVVPDTTGFTIVARSQEPTAQHGSDLIIGKIIGIAIFVIIAGSLIVTSIRVMYQGYKRRSAAKAARTIEGVTPEETFVRKEWAETDRRKADRAQRAQGGFELQRTVARDHQVVEPPEVYRHPRMDWV